MLYILFLLKKHKIIVRDLANYLNIGEYSLRDLLHNRRSFNISLLEKCKYFFVSLNILDDDFDIGEFLNDVEIENENFDKLRVENE